MSSDPRITSALRAVAAQRATYRGMVITSLERIRAVLATTQGEERARLQLGAVGASHIDAARFAELSHNLTMDATARSTITHAADFLREIANAPEQHFAVEVPERESPRDAIGYALSQWGRVFGVTTAAELARGGRFNHEQHSALLDAWPFEFWTKAQRLVAPPIVAAVNGSDLHVGDLAGLLDGAAHIVIVVAGDCPPAALARLITPATFVLQTADEKGLDRFSAYEGPAIAAMVPTSAATFIHDPAGGSELWQRLSIWSRPAHPQRRTLAGLSAAQQQQELLQLTALAAPPSLPISAVDALAPGSAWNGNATDRLAQWLLAQAGDTNSS